MPAARSAGTTPVPASPTSCRARRLGRAHGAPRGPYGVCQVRPRASPPLLVGIRARPGRQKRYEAPVGRTRTMEPSSRTSWPSLFTARASSEVLSVPSRKNWTPTCNSKALQAKMP